MHSHFSVDVGNKMDVHLQKNTKKNEVNKKYINIKKKKVKAIETSALRMLMLFSSVCARMRDRA